MNKQQAADLLGVTTRAVERYTAQGKLSVRYEKGKTRPVAVYSEDELRSLKQEIENPPLHRPAVESAQTTSPGSNNSQALIPTNREQGLAEFVGFLKGAFESSQRTPMAMLSIADKIMLTLPEAALLTSLSRNHLRQAIEEKKLKARIIGRGWRVKRDDLDAYVRKL